MIREPDRTGDIPGGVIDGHEASQIPQELQVTKHSVGYTEVVLSCGDRIRLYLYVDRFRWSSDLQQFTPEYRVVSEVQPRELGAASITSVLQDCWRC